MTAWEGTGPHHEDRSRKVEPPPSASDSHRVAAPRRYRPKSCAYCGAVFRPTGSRQEYCTLHGSGTPKFARERDAERKDRRRHPDRYPAAPPRTPGDAGYTPVFDTTITWPRRAQRARWRAVRDYWVRCGVDRVLAGQMAWQDAERVLAGAVSADGPYWETSDVSADSRRSSDLRKRDGQIGHFAPGAAADAWQPRESWARAVVDRARRDGRQA